MILDLHTHSVVSDDGRAKVDNYCQWIRKRELPLDGFVLTEHRQYDDQSNYDALAAEFDLVILKASEVETDYGHVLVFGVNDDLRASFDFARVDLPLGMVIEESRRCGAVAVPCHPGRVTVGMCAHFETKGAVEGVEVIEVYNGGSREGEDDQALALAQARGYRAIGGSDSHIVSHIGRCGTEFNGDVRSIDDLVDALRGDSFEARTWR